MKKIKNSKMNTQLKLTFIHLNGRVDRKNVVGSVVFINGKIARARVYVKNSLY